MSMSKGYWFEFCYRMAISDLSFEAFLPILRRRLVKGVQIHARLVSVPLKLQLVNLKDESTATWVTWFLFQELPVKRSSFVLGSRLLCLVRLEL